MIYQAPYKLLPGGNFALRLHPAHLGDLRKSGLSDETVKAAGVYSIRPTDISHFFSRRRGVPRDIESALCFPYQGGEFARIKLFPPLGKMKYAQPPKTGARLYIPLPVNDGAVVVCEGEKKTLAASQAGLNAVGMGGIWNWLTNGNLIIDLQLIDWNDREVTVIPDSDVFRRMDLMRAVYALGRELQAQGACVYVAQISQRGEAKVGLDDYLAEGGHIDGLEVFSLSHRIFKRCHYWHGQWKFKRALKAAA